MTETLRKWFAGRAKALGDNGRIEVVMSTEGRDRDGDIIRQAGWDLRNFAQNPVFIADHKYDLSHIIGHWEDVAVVTSKADGQGPQLVGTAIYDVGEGNDLADKAYRLAQKGRAAFSVGFIPDMTRAVETEGSGEGGDWPTFEFHAMELLETSQVAVPSNPEGLQRVSNREVWAKSLNSNTGPDIVDETDTDDVVGRIRSELLGMVDHNYDTIIERLKADYPKLFEATPEFSEVMARW